MANEPLICTTCDVEMNMHAEKVDYAAGVEHPEVADAQLDGVLVELHTCPDCGESASRVAPQSGESG